jgi:hypothetical protein
MNVTDLTPPQLLALHSQVADELRSRGITRFNTSRQLSALRDLAAGHFDILAGVLLNEDYSVMRAALIPHAIALEHSSFFERTNSHRFLLRDDIWNAPGVRDVTAKLQAVTF